jgi:hypothetical protein
MICEARQSTRGLFRNQKKKHVIPARQSRFIQSSSKGRDDDDLAMLWTACYQAL